MIEYKTRYLNALFAVTSVWPAHSNCYVEQTKTKERQAYKAFLASKEIMMNKTIYLSKEFAMKRHVLYEALFQQTNLEIRIDLSG